MTPELIKLNLAANREVKLYFTDSKIPATVLDCAGKSVYLKHGSRKFWIRLTNKLVARVE